MESTTVQPVAEPKPASQWTSRQQIRSSSLLLMGRFPSKLLNFASHVLVVHLLTKNDYGAFAYALSMVVFGQALVTFGLDRAITRFLPIYQERGEYGKLVGTGFLVVGTMLFISLLMILSLFGLQSFIGGTLLKDPRTVSLLMVLIFLAPLQAIDEVVIGLFAVFGSARNIFFRKHVIGPALKLSAVLLVFVFGGSLYTLAAGYLAASALGIAIYARKLMQLLHEEGITPHINWRSAQIPWKEVFAFTIPLLSTDLLYIAVNTMDAVMLEHFEGISSVAVLRAVLPIALLNQLVMNSFGVLFTPMAARLFARNDREGINQHYWLTAIWVAVLSFPIFILTFSCAGPITLLLYGSRYEQSAMILAVLSVGFYFDASLGFNGTTLKVYGKLRYIVCINAFSAVLNLTANLLLIPRYGAMGAAMGTCGTLVVYNILKQVGLKMATGITLFDRRFLRVYAMIVASTAALVVPQLIWSFPPYYILPLGALASVAVIRMNRDLLNVNDTIPELLRFPVLRWLLKS